MAMTWEGNAHRACPGVENMVESKDTIPTEEYGEDWLKCLSYEGPGAKDPSGGSLPQGWHILDLISAVVLKRSKKIITVEIDEEGELPIKKGDLIIKAIMDEEIIGDLYDEDADAILLSDASGRTHTRLGWYTDPIVGGRDGLRIWATSAIRRQLAGPGVKTG